MAKTSVALAATAALTCALTTTPVWAQGYPVTDSQRTTAQQVASRGVPLGDLADNAPDSYTVKRGDTLWDISKLFLKSPWRWPELWGMNLDDIKNPHRIYPGQNLYLERKGGMASLRVGNPENGLTAEEAGMETVQVTPRTRYESLGANALTSLKSNVIEAFLAEPLVVSETELQSAARLVSTQDNRVLLTRGDRAYVRGPSGNPLLDDQPQLKKFRVFREAKPLKDPASGEVLGYEAQYVGKATLMRGESTSTLTDKERAGTPVVVPGTIDITAAKEEMRVGDRMLPEPPRVLQTYIPHAPSKQVDGRIISVYGSAVVNAAQSQVVAINQGTRDGMEPGHVLAILKDGEVMVDKNDPNRTLMKLPDERNGLLMVFRTFDRVSYALILEITDGVRIGDRLMSPR